MVPRRLDMATTRAVFSRIEFDYPVGWAPDRPFRAGEVGVTRLPDGAEIEITLTPELAADLNRKALSAVVPYHRVMAA